MADYSDTPKVEETSGYTEPLPSVHPIKALFLHGIFLLLQLLSWISTVVVFSAILHTVTIGDNAKFACFWSHVEGNGQKLSYNEFADMIGGYARNCQSAGKGVVAMQVFAFLSILGTISLTVIRALGKSEIVPGIKTNTKSVLAEALLTAVSSVLFFISLLIWGGACYSSFQSQPNVSVRAVGFAFTIVCFFFLLISIGVILFIRRDVTDDSVNSSGFVHQTDSVSYHPSAYPPAVESSYGTPASDNYGSYQSV